MEQVETQKNNYINHIASITSTEGDKNIEKMDKN